MLYKLPNIDELLKKIPLCKYFYASKHFMHVKCLILESNLGPPQHLSWNSLWRKLMTEGN